MQCKNARIHFERFDWMAFQLTQAEMVELLAQLHSVRPEKRDALRARLGNFQRLKFPSGANTGSGRKAIYGLTQVISLCLAFECLQLGMTPARIVEGINKYPRIILAFAGAELEGEPWIWSVDPHALADLSDAGSGGDWISIQKGVERHTRRIANINLTILIKQILEIIDTAKQAEFLQEIQVSAQFE